MTDQAKESPSIKKNLEKNLEKKDYSINPSNSKPWAYWSSLKPSLFVHRYEDSQHRFYFTKDKGNTIQIMSGITTFLSRLSTEREAIERWKKDNANWEQLLDLAASYGSIYHEICSEILLGKGIDTSKVNSLSSIMARGKRSKNTPPKDVLAFLKFKEDYNIQPIIIEGALCINVDGHYLAMTIDNLCSIEFEETSTITTQAGVFSRGPNKGQPKFEKVKSKVKRKVLALVDYKSNYFEKERKNYYEAHKLQLYGAKLAIKQNFGLDVEHLYNWSPNNWNEEPSYTLHQWKINQEDIDTWDAYFKLGVIKKYNTLKGQIFSSNLSNANDYEWISYEEMAKRLLG